MYSFGVFFVVVFRYINLLYISLPGDLAVQNLHIDTAACVAANNLPVNYHSACFIFFGII